MTLRTAAVLVLCLTTVTAVARQPSSRPRLVVVLVVDQMRGDYITWYGKTWTKGLRRLVDRGAWFKDAAYPYLNTVTCAGHATIATGAFPRTHGLVSNYWYDRAARKRVSCTEEPGTEVVSYGKPTDDHYGPGTLKVPTFADELRAQTPTPPKVVTLSLKERTAITLAGHHSDTTLWFNDRAQGFVTSTDYTSVPVPFVEAFFKNHPITADYGKTWALSLPSSGYQYSDDGAGEVPATGWTATFPHVLTGKNGAPDAQFYEQWKESPFADMYLAALAKDAVASLKMGRGASIDYLAISFSALDNIGHDFGPRSHEIQDALLKLDATVGDLLAFLDKTVGAGKYVVALSADHGVAVIPEQAKADGADAGRVRLDDIRTRVEAALAPLGPGPHVARIEYADVYFVPGVYERIASDPALVEAVSKAMLSVPGIAKVFTADQLASTAPTSEPELRAARLGYYRERSGDMINVLKPNWIHASGTSPNATTHGTTQPYDARVPVIMMGAGITAGAFAGEASPADIAPTLAMLCGIQLKHAEGRVLRAASQSQ